LYDSNTTCMIQKLFEIF